MLRTKTISALACTFVLTMGLSACDKAEDKKTDDKKADKKGDDKKGDDKAEDKTDAKAEPAEPAAPAGPTCEDLSKKIVELLSVQGDDAFLKAEDVPKLTEGCEKGGALEKHKADVECTMKAADLEALKACGKGSDDMMKFIMTSIDG